MRIRIIILCIVFSAKLFAQNGMISGFIRDKANGEALAYANVYLIEKPIGTMSDKKGYYVITNIPPGKDTIVFSLIGYKELKKEIVIKPFESITLNVEMEIEPILMKPVVVSGERLRFEREIGVSLRPIQLRDIQPIPAFIEKDLFRALQFIPGVVFVSDFSSALYVRGGSAAENLVLLDGTVIYNPYHVGGMFSTFNLDAIKSVDLYMGGFSAKYGERISAVLDVETKSGNNKKFCSTGELSLISIKTVLETPIPLWNGSAMISGRRTYWDYIFKGIAKLWNLPPESTLFPYYFYDSHGKINFEPTNRTKITMAIYNGDDILDADWVSLKWGNTSASLKYRQVLTPKLFSTLIIPKSRFRFRIMPYLEKKEGRQRFFDILNILDDFGIKHELNYFITDKNSITLGAQAKRVNLRWKISEKVKEKEKIIMDTTYFDGKRAANHICTYIENDYKKGNIITNIGIRYNYWNAYGGKVIINDSIIERKGGIEHKIEPRLSAKYFIKPNLSIKGAYGHYYQFITIPPLGGKAGEEFAKLPMELFSMWELLGGPLKPLQSIHYIVGIEKWLAEETNLTIECYYKNIYNCLEMRELDGTYIQGTGFAYGAEFMLKMKNNWLGYSYSLTKRKIEEEFYPPHDRRHTISFSFHTPISKTWSFHIAWIYGSGLPYTGEVGKYQKIIYDPWTNTYYYDYYEPGVILGRRSGARLPPYHRMDIEFEREKFFTIIKLPIYFYLQIVNVYNNRNILWVYWNTETEPPKLYGITMMPFFPSLGLRWRF